VPKEVILDGSTQRRKWLNMFDGLIRG